MNTSSHKDFSFEIIQKNEQMFGAKSYEVAMQLEKMLHRKAEWANERLFVEKPYQGECTV